MRMVLVEDDSMIRQRPWNSSGRTRRVFDPFYRVLGGDEHGSGLGLSIVQAISARVGASISLGPVNDASSPGLRVR